MAFEWKSWFMEVWESNRNLTNNIVRALADADAMDQVMVEGMRPFRDMTLEVIGMEQWNVRGLAYDEWDFKALPEALKTAPVDEVLDFAREVRDETLRVWPTIPFEAITKMRPSPASFIPAGTAMEWLTYALENEIHHRGQGYVYLRLLGQEPPAFYNRGE